LAGGKESSRRENVPFKEGPDGFIPKNRKQGGGGMSRARIVYLFIQKETSEKKWILLLRYTAIVIDLRGIIQGTGIKRRGISSEAQAKQDGTLKKGEVRLGVPSGGVVSLRWGNC